ncbi:sugar ABC transporter ATP-binding protein [Martelella soudanensis]|uniref:sugar ABC transporter ATP-binding protein n=1 Tax=unclassified Martelella TaxID=2629616 RepID=UPI0015DFDD30|nr:MULTISPECIES: sugar ABC transporter ATP-binding protein [unclassified Martelella]
MLLEMTGITKSFGSGKVLDDVRFTLDEGEIVALLGANGAGKSTLMKIMTGIYSGDAGAIFIDGREATIRNPADAMRHGIRLVPQELQVLPDLSVAENIFLGALPTHGDGPLSRVDVTTLRERASAILDSLGISHIDVTHRLSRYSVSEQRLVEIARALAADARILVLDEPTASLSAPECDRLFEIMRRLKARGVCTIFISHFLDEVFQISDRIEVLRDGRNVANFMTVETDTHSVLTAMLGRELTDLFPSHSSGFGETVFSSRNLSAPPRVRDVTFDVHAREIHGIFGLIGSGIEDLGKVLFGARHPESGSLTLVGSAFRPAGVNDAIRAGVGFVSAERKSEGIVPDLGLADNFTLPFLDRHSRGQHMSTASQRGYARKWIEALGVRTTGVDQKISGLSGGNQQKVCIGRWLVDDLKLLILEEPTRGVDLGARKDIYAHLRRLADQGLAIIVISTDAEEVGGLADGSTVLIDGVAAESFDEPVDAHTLMATATREAAA